MGGLLKSFLKVFLAGGVTMAALAFSGGSAQAESVVASFYGEELAGNPTASGEPFDPSGLTAAHPSLPFGTQAEVCYQGCTTVTINDRGPFVEGRGLDLSAGAAQAIGLTGVDTVEFNIVGSGGETGSTGASGADTDTVAADTAVPDSSVAYDANGDAYDPFTGLYYIEDPVATV
ncbi:MAG: septal ring lytic transglycosylase RlpA family protein [Actinomycetota bacterium]|jgi:rare lipoprotein A|nr:septal ring lytic transglycosylase RlpA family protein [Rubrobacter sp.]MDQ3507316.1 septal ring lytic transglycosylase RlpA family protein [Actinomycetota bacterium]